MRAFRKSWLLGVVGVLAGCAAQATPGDVNEAEVAVGDSSDAGTPELAPVGSPKPFLFIEGATLWNQTIPVCWWQSPNLTGDRTFEKTIIQEAIERTWLRAANISVRWAGSCPTTGTEQFMAIELANNTLKENLGVDGQTGVLGMGSLGIPNTYTDTFPTGGTPTIQTNPGMKVWVNQDGTENVSRLEYVAVHEFGHVLGFAHEQDSPLAEPYCTSATGNTIKPGTQYGPWDRDTIMNYCADSNHGYLSEGDVMNVRAIYGLPNVWGNFAADVTGDGRADMLEVNANGINVRASTGAGSFAAQTAWYPSVFNGSRDTLFADVNGDGKADAVAVNNGGIFVLLSTGTGFVWNGQWAAAGTYGQRKTLAADVTGDGKADIIAVNNTGITVLASTGSAFKTGVSWSGPFFGTRTTLAGDVNGDGKADIVTDGTNASGQTGWQLALSTGAAFQISTATGAYAANSRAAAIADFNGDGKADYIALNDWGINVSLSLGASGFSSSPISSASPFFGVQTSLLADVNGDHKTDAVAIGASSVDVLLSTGTGFGTSARWAGSFVAQPYYLADQSGSFWGRDNRLDQSPLGDWQPGSYKGGCGLGQPVNGVSRANGAVYAHDIHCAPTSVGPVNGSACYALEQINSDNRKYGDNGVDWDPGSYKMECAAGEYVQSIAQTAAGHVSAILCCPAPVAHNSCAAQVWANYDSPGYSSSDFDWDPTYNKGQCPAGQYVAGVSTPASSSPSVSGEVHGLLCCSP